MAEILDVELLAPSGPTKEEAEPETDEKPEPEAEANPPALAKPVPAADAKSDVDPGPRVAAMTDAPVAFHFEEEHPEVPVKVDLSKEAMKMFGELKGADVRATFFTPMPGKKNQPLSMVSFYSNESPRLFKAWVDAHQCRLRLLGAAANARIIDMLADAADVRDRLLGPREREALSWLASGRRVDRIAEKMNVSGRTVEFHLKNASAKLGARTREEALARAILSGEVEL